VAECFARREFVSGFTGSAGTAVVLKDKALLWTDGRYFLQAEKELGEEWTLMRAGLPATPDYVDYLASQLPKGAKVGLDPHTVSAGQADRLIRELEAKGITVVPSQGNLVDAVWGDARPAPPAAPLRVHSLEYAGESVSACAG
jgi:Xaa-Pro aminopeptidase